MESPPVIDVKREGTCQKLFLNATTNFFTMHIRFLSKMTGFPLISFHYLPFSQSNMNNFILAPR